MAEENKEETVVIEGTEVTYYCWKCEKNTIHEVEKTLYGYGDELDISFLSFCKECDIYEQFYDLDDINEKHGLKYFYLMDLERTITFHEPHYWVKSNWGYTTKITEAGLYNELETKYRVEADVDNRTIAIPVEVIEGILRKI